MKISIILCAAGKGERAGFQRNKLLAPFYGANALYYSVTRAARLAEALCRRGDLLAEIIVTSSAEDEKEIAAIVSPYGCKTVRGGATRTESVFNALREVTGEIVLIQDGARPFTTEEQYLSCIDCVKEHHSAIVALPAVDTTATADDGCISHIPDRSTVFRVQTPQGFFTADIRRAYELAMTDGQTYTDDGSVYSRYVSPARICPCGSEANRKLTYRDDFTQGVLSPEVRAPENCRVGFGADVHAFGKEQDYVMLCGVKIPCDTGFVAHSDGDVALHAVMDAILSAAGLMDIGHYFPDNDPAYLGADSGVLLKTVVSLVGEQGYKVNGLAVTVQAEKPRLAKYIEKMTERLSLLTGAEKSAVAVSAGSCEGLGFVGEGRGVYVTCAAVLAKKGS